MKKKAITNLPDGTKIELVDYYSSFFEYYKFCEMETKEWFLKNIQSDWCIFDIGANIGYYTILFAKLAYKGIVYAFEPTETISKLKNNIAYYKLTNVKIFDYAFSNKSGVYKDKIFKIWGEKPEEKFYTWITIDDFVEEYNITKLDCIKIDVDSYDFEVLQGSLKTIERFNPYIMVELNYALNLRNTSNTEALHWLSHVGYSEAIVFDYDNFLLKKKSSKNFVSSNEIILRFNSK